MYQEQPNPVYKFLKQVWPYIYRGINSAIYFIINIIKYIVREGIEMIKNGGSGA